MNKSVRSESRSTAIAMVFFFLGAVALGILAAAGSLGTALSLLILAIYLVGALPAVISLVLLDRSKKI